METKNGGHLVDDTTILAPMTLETTAIRQVPIATGKIERITFTPSDGIAAAVRDILTHIGESPEREGLARTPQRVAQLWAELTAGYHVDPVALINDAVFTVDYDEMVLVKDIDFYSLCEHHLLPFTGRAHVAYVPRGKVIGLSKIPRIVDMFARRLQIQEQLTVQIAEFLETTLQPQGVAVAIEGTHMCAAIRSVRQPNAEMITSTLRGVFRSNPEMRAEFMGFRRS